MSDKYSVSVFWNEEDDCFFASCSEFPLLSAHGDTREEALSEFQVVLEMAIESYTEDGIDLPEPIKKESHSGQFRLRVPKSLHRSLVEMAEREGVSLNTCVISLLSENIALKKLYPEQFERIVSVLESMTSILVTQNDTLQVYTKQLGSHESGTGSQELISGNWLKMQDIHTFEINNTQ